MRNNIIFDNLERDAIDLFKKLGRPELFVEKRTQKKKKLFDELARDLVPEEARLKFKIDTFYTLLDTFSSQLEDFTTIVHKFKVLDPKFFVQKSFKECKKALSELADMMNQILRRMVQADAVISDVQKIYDVLHILEICEKSGIF